MGHVQTKHVVGQKPGNLPTPPIPPVVDIGGAKLHPYGALIAGGAITATALFAKSMTKSGISTEKLPVLAFGALAAGLVGARAGRVLGHWEDYKDNPAKIPQMWEGGLSIYGGVFGGAIAGSLIAHHYHMPIAKLFDAVAIGLPVAQGIGRWGNYINQEIVGTPTDLPWGMKVDPEKRPVGFEDRQSFHPTFLYESLLDLGIAGGVYALSKRWTNRPSGALFLAYVGGYSLARFGMEFIRTDNQKKSHGLRTNQWVSLGVAATAAAGMGVLMLKHRL